uniref:Uncharacterized protein n=1 Tax=Moniliophthora roreri TaxID=221103 RepID=A0A0W0EVA7_MONRR
MGNLVVSGGSPSEFASWDAQVAHEKRPETIWPPHQGLDKNLNSEGWPDSKEWRKSVVLDPDGLWLSSGRAYPLNYSALGMKNTLPFPLLVPQRSKEILGTRMSTRGGNLASRFPAGRVVRCDWFGIARTIDFKTPSSRSELPDISSSFPEEYCTTPARFPVLEEDRSSYQDFELRGLAKVKEMTMSDVLNLDGPK